MGESQLIGADAVYAVAPEIEDQRKSYLHAETGELDYGPGLTLNDNFVKRLVDVCRSDIKKMQV